MIIKIDETSSCGGTLGSAAFEFIHGEELDERGYGQDADTFNRSGVAGERVDTRTIKDPIFGFVFDVKGLIANLSLEGAKFTRLNQ
jgi:hypothetical protein